MGLFFSHLIFEPLEEFELCMVTRVYGGVCQPPARYPLVELSKTLKQLDNSDRYRNVCDMNQLNMWDGKWEFIFILIEDAELLRP